MYKIKVLGPPETFPRVSNNSFRNYPSRSFDLSAVGSVNGVVACFADLSLSACSFKGERFMRNCRLLPFGRIYRKWAGGKVQCTKQGF